MACIMTPLEQTKGFQRPFRVHVGKTTWVCPSQREALLAMVNHKLPVLCAMTIDPSLINEAALDNAAGGSSPLSRITPTAVQLDVSMQVVTDVIGRSTRVSL